MSEKKHKTPKLITGEAKLKELIKSIIRQELEEMSGTGDVADFSSPFAVSKKGQSHGEKATAAMTDMGFTVAKEIDEKKVGKKVGKKIRKHLDDLEKLDEAVSRYQRFKEHPMKDRSKISMVVQEITKMLREVDFLMTVNEKLKTELKIPKDDLWKRTESRIVEIRSRLKSLESRLKTFHR
jgi:hypothetical protein